MVNYNCIAIGINGYQFFQPLSYAQADAQALQQFLLEESDLSLQKSLLFTDTSDRIAEKSTYPTKENILYGINNQVRQHSNGVQKSKTSNSSILWFFFSGYGANYNGEDYLMPIDGQPNDIPNTGISMRSLFEFLQQQGASKIIAILDMNRSPGIMGVNTVGEQTVELAAQMGIAAILSCRPQEFSHEVSSLGNGIFTTALLEALRYYSSDITLDLLEGYLQKRLPELSEHHWRPVQTPVIVLPGLKASKQLILLSAQTNQTNWEGMTMVNSQVNSLQANSGNNSNSTNNGKGKGVATQVRETNGKNNSSNNSKVNSNKLVKDNKSKTPKSKNSRKKIAWWEWLVLGTSGALLFTLLVGEVRKLFNRNLAITQNPTESPSNITSPPTEPESNSNTSSSTTKPEANSNVTSPVVPLPPSPSPNSQNQNFQPENNASPSPESIVKVPTAPPFVPQSNNIAKSSNSSPESTESTSQKLESREILNKARILIQSSQASGFSKAIKEVRKVKSNDPLYQEARADIKRWSQVILDIAQGRAAQNNFTDAIAAAQLVPLDVKDIHTQAQTSIELWNTQMEQQRLNNLIIQAAKKLISPTQASSYNQAITTLKQISSNQPRYQEAQHLISQWSKRIYLMANSRAARGNFTLAIQTANLVPEDGPFYESAKKAIARWKQGQR